MFWFWFNTDHDRQAIGFLMKNDRQAAHEIWKEIISKTPEETYVEGEDPDALWEEDPRKAIQCEIAKALNHRDQVPAKSFLPNWKQGE